MSEPLPSLEKDRSEVLRQISHSGDLRPGSIMEVMGRCSKSNCHCAQPGDPGHGPNLRLSQTQDEIHLVRLAPRHQLFPA